MQIDDELAAGDPRMARSALDEARTLLDRSPLAPAVSRRPLYRLDGALALASEDPQAALSLAHQALVLSQAHSIDPDASLLAAEDLLLRAQARKALGDADGARADALLAERHERDSAGIDRPLTRQAQALAGGRPPRPRIF